MKFESFSSRIKIEVTAISDNKFFKLLKNKKIDYIHSPSFLRNISSDASKFIHKVDTNICAVQGSENTSVTAHDSSNNLKDTSFGVWLTSNNNIIDDY